MHRIACGVLPVLVGTAAFGQGVVFYGWDVSDTGNGDGVIEPGESMVATLYATIDPPQVGFAGSIYEIGGNDVWQAGTVDVHDNLLDSLTDDGQLQADNSVTNIESFQLPPLFNPAFDNSNPIAVYRLVWTPESFAFGTVEVSSRNHLNSDVYTDDFGTSVTYSSVTSTAMVLIVPAPSGVALLALGGLVAARRRRA